MKGAIDSDRGNRLIKLKLTTNTLLHTIHLTNKYIVKINKRHALRMEVIGRYRETDRKKPNLC